MAVIDWNYHLNLPIATSKAGVEIVTRGYNRRTRQWDIKHVKVDKRYGYIPVLMAKIINLILNDLGSVTRTVPLNVSDPGNIAPTIAHTPAPATKDIPQRESRF